MKGIKCLRRHFSHNAGITWYFYHLYLCICIFLVSADLNTFLLLLSPPLIRDHPRLGHAVADPCGSCGCCAYADMRIAMRM